ncbi:MAG: hypothetical protein K1X88_19105 [Nannocystaceae bacterium]|nr:hypothetical protein [Nannocystaceae bacterium]
MAGLRLDLLVFGTASALALGLACATDGPSGSGGSSGGSGMDSAGSEGHGADAGTSHGGADSTGGTGDRYHPLDYAQASVHGPAMKLHEEDCRGCHGDDLLGGSSEVDCDSCHEPDWRTDCVFCHGGEKDGTGAPPRDIDGTTDTSMLSFIAHSRHVSQYQHAPYDCTQCHVKPLDVLSSGHVFDDTDARAEVDFSAGISSAGTWDGNACANLWCHGNGQTANGSYAHTDPEPNCGGCHPYPGTSNTAFNTMSGQHSRHINEGINCAECHDPLAIESHVDGKPDLDITVAGFNVDEASLSCSGLCHLKPHNEQW